MSLDILKWIKGWRLDKFFSNFKQNVAKVAVVITEAIKTATEGTLLTTLSAIIDSALKTHLASDALQLIHTASLKALAVELAIVGLPDNPTEQDILEFEKRVFEAISGLSVYGQSKLWTSFAAQIFGIIKQHVDNNDEFTYAVIVDIIEKGYQAYLKDKEDNEADD